MSWEDSWENWDTEVTSPAIAAVFVAPNVAAKTTGLSFKAFKNSLVIL